MQIYCDGWGGGGGGDCSNSGKHIPVIAYSCFLFCDIFLYLFMVYFTAPNMIFHFFSFWELPIYMMYKTDWV